jgi:hypothetical protein
MVPFQKRSGVDADGSEAYESAWGTLTAARYWLTANRLALSMPSILTNASRYTARVSTALNRA